MGRVRLLLLVTAILVQFYGGKSCLEEEKRALLDIKEYMKPHNTFIGSHLLPSWVRDSNSDCCDWERVTCDSYSGQIIHLSLYNITSFDKARQSCLSYPYSLNMSLFFSFKHLRSLNLSYNCFDDLIEIQDGRSKSTFTMLETLDLSYNVYLNQSIFKSLSSLTSLKNLLLVFCLIEGPLPVQELSVFGNLELLDLTFNSFTSPSVFQDTHSLSKLKKLRTLILNYNRFDKDIFKSLVALPALKSLFLSYNVYEGEWSLDNKVLANLSNLEVLILRSKKLRGPLPIQGLCKMKQLQELDLSYNMFTGPLDRCLGNLTSLRALDLSRNSLNGSISASFFAPLASLEYLSLSYNNFEGLFSLNLLANNSKLKVLSLGEMKNTKTFQVETENPPWVPSFQLEFLQLSSCQVNLHSRMTPTFLSHQHGLQYIDLSYSNLIDNFPNYLLANNPRLETMLLDGNSFTGFFDLIQPLDQLRHLKLSNNKIQGKLPNNIGFFLPHLEYLNVSSNMFEGDIPASIGKMSNLTSLDLAYNNFSGKIPEQILPGSISLQTLRLSNNSLEGHIFHTPTNLGSPTPMKFGSLEILIMDNNKFNGTLEDGILLIPLRILDISGNKLSGKLPGWIANPTLDVLRLSRNSLEGEIPEDLCKYYLDLVDLSHNRFSGAIPSCLFMSRLRYIHLQGNSFTGTIPETFSNISSNLITVDLRDNKFSGIIPESIYRLSHMRFLLLAGNTLEGLLPSQICQLYGINVLDLSRNNFTGSIPSCFNNMSFGKTEALPLDALSVLDIVVPSFADDYQYPHFNLGHGDTFTETLSFPEEEEVAIVTKSLSFSYKGNPLQMMSALDLSSNRFTGEIPNQIGDLYSLRTLNLSHNHLNGSIPKSLHDLKEIESLDLSHNNLKGEIPPQLQDLNFLSNFNVSYNNLSGRAPENGQFANFDDRSYKGNQYLSWRNSNRHNATQPSPQTPLNETERSDSVVDFSAFYWSFGVSYVMVILTLVTVLWINPYWRRIWLYYITTCLERCFGRFFEDAFF